MENRKRFEVGNALILGAALFGTVMVASFGLAARNLTQQIHTDTLAFIASSNEIIKDIAEQNKTLDRINDHLRRTQSGLENKILVIPHAPAGPR